MVTSIKDDLKRAKYVCTTADLWSSYRRSYMGVTCHWLDPENLERKSVVLACKRLMGKHDYKAIGICISDVHQLYGLSVDKISFTITDTAANFLKAFREFKYPPEIFEDDDEIGQCDTEDQVTFSDVDQILSQQRLY